MFLVGITASRYGLTSAQRTYLRARLTGLITEHGQVELHQGWCVGGDEESLQHRRHDGDTPGRAPGTWCRGTVDVDRPGR